MSHSQTSGVALVASAAEDDWVTPLVFAWMTAKRSENTRAAYARDIGVAPARRTGRAPSWLGWCVVAAYLAAQGGAGGRPHLARLA
jgi:hypothetical protein